MRRGSSEAMGALATGDYAQSVAKQVPERGLRLKAQHLDAKETDQRTSAAIGFIAGGALFAGGLVLFFTSANPDESEARAQIVPWINGTSAGVSGRF